MQWLMVGLKFGEAERRKKSEEREGDRGGCFGEEGERRGKNMGLQLVAGFSGDDRERGK